MYIQCALLLRPSLVEIPIFLHLVKVAILSSHYLTDDCTSLIIEESQWQIRRVTTKHSLMHKINTLVSLIAFQSFDLF